MYGSRQEENSKEWATNDGKKDRRGFGKNDMMLENLIQNNCKFSVIRQGDGMSILKNIKMRYNELSDKGTYSC